MTRKINLIEKLKNREYRKHFLSAQVRRIVTAQIRALREAKGWTQQQLGEQAGGMKANAISRLENPSYGDFTVNTLLRLAEAFDVGLVVRFVSFAEVVSWNENVTITSYVPPDFSEYLRHVSRGQRGAVPRMLQAASGEAATQLALTFESVGAGSIREIPLAAVEETYTVTPRPRLEVAAIRHIAADFNQEYSEIASAAKFLVEHGVTQGPQNLANMGE